MNYRSIQCYFILGAFLSMIVGSTIILAQSNPAAIESPTPSLSVKPSLDSHIGERLTGLEHEVQKLKKPPKDIWDKLSSISALISGGLVALVGLLVTYVLNERNRITTEEQKRREFAVSQVQIIQSFMPQLQSGEPREKEAALLAIQILDPKSTLGLDLADLYRDEGSINAMRKMASGPDAESAKRAQQTLESMVTVSFKYFSPHTDDLRLSVSSLGSFYGLIYQVFLALKGGVEAFTYEKSWILRDQATRKEFKTKRTIEGNKVTVDLRSLEEVGIEPGMILEVMPVKSEAERSPSATG